MLYLETLLRAERSLLIVETIYLRQMCLLDCTILETFSFITINHDMWSLLISPIVRNLT
jgi:hypothetical protein